MRKINNLGFLETRNKNKTREWVREALGADDELATATSGRFFHVSLFGRVRRGSKGFVVRFRRRLFFVFSCQGFLLAGQGERVDQGSRNYRHVWKTFNCVQGPCWEFFVGCPGSFFFDNISRVRSIKAGA